MAKILVVDDEPGMRQVISKILVPLGHEIIDTDEGARSLQIAKEQAPDIVLLDIRLSDMDSSEIISGLKNIRQTIPVIILSGFGDVEAAVELVKIGAFDYISKPFKVNDFISLINKALSKSGQLNHPPQAPRFQNSGAPLIKDGSGGYGLPAMHVKKRGHYLAPLIISMIAFALAAGGYFGFKNYINVPKDAEFKIPYSNPSGICFENNNIWVSDWAGEVIYKHSLGKDLKLDASLKAGVMTPAGLAYDGKNIWSSSSLEQKIYKHRLDAALSVETSFASPGPSPSGLSFDGKNLWSADFQQGKIYKHKGSNPAETEASFDVPAQNPCGLFIREKYVYVADGKTNRIYKLSAETFFLASVLEMPGFENQKRQLASIACDGRSVWACAGGVDRLFRYRLSSLKKVKF